MKLNDILLFGIFILLLNGCGGGSGTTSTSDVIDITPPNFISGNSVSIEENQINILAVQADDITTVAYAISGGEDSSQFSIGQASGLLTFKSAPDFEAPTDSNKDNIYEVTVSATDTSNNQSQQSIIVTVTDINELYENDADGDYIPNNIEIDIGSNPNNSDENDNGIDDGLDMQGVYGDTFFDKLWYIRSLGTYTNDSNVLTIIGNDLDLLDIYHTYMGYNKGNNIIVQVVDTGVDADHEDLVDNIDLSRSYDGENPGDPSGRHPHGTMVAGIMAASAFNGKGVRGIIPFAKIAGSNWLEHQSIEALTKAWLTGVGANEIVVSNNSWGVYFDTDTEYEDIMKLGTSTLRDGKGRIYLFAAGNEREDQGNANLQYILSNRFAIAVAALKHDNTYAEYSTPGSNILVSGYGGNYYDDSPTIGTTTIMGASSNTGDINSKTSWAEDTNENYTYMMNGTSAASPIVAASVALVLEACPDLSWRDIKYLVAKHAKQVDPSNHTWVTNNAGFKHSIDYGFGLINAESMINECTSIYINLPTEQNLILQKTFNMAIKDNNITHAFHMDMIDNIAIEWVEVTVDSNHTNASDFRIELTSPQSTKVTLIFEGSKVSGAWMDGGFRFSTPAMMNEESNGNWIINIIDTKSGIEGSLKNIELKIYGH